MMSKENQRVDPMTYGDEELSGNTFTTSWNITQSQNMKCHKTTEHHEMSYNHRDKNIW